MKLQLNCKDPYDKDAEHMLQQAMLSLDFSGPGIKFYDFCCGRASGKTVGIVLLILQMCIEEPGIKILVLSPTYRKLKDNVLTIWRELLPRELYKYRSSDDMITFVNGSKIFLRSRSVDNPTKGQDATRGLTVSCCISDEASEKFSMIEYTTALACIRKKSKFNCFITCSTPALNDYIGLVTSPNHKLYTFFTTSNPHLPEGFISSAKDSMSPMEFAREFEASFATIGNKVWPTFSTKDFYLGGNIIKYQHDKSMPFILSMDIGSAHASYIIWQQANVDGILRTIVTGEYEPKLEEDSSVKRILEKVYMDYGTPIRVIGGNDLNTRSSQDNSTGLYFIRQMFGGVPVSMPHDKARNKLVQYDCTNAMVCNGAGERRLLVADSMASYDPEKRGVLKLFEMDTFPEKVSGHEIFGKGPNYPLEHVRDNVFYAVATYFNPPRMIQTNHLAQKNRSQTNAF